MTGDLFDDYPGEVKQPTPLSQPCGGDLSDCVNSDRDYHPPVGPKHQMHQGPGLRGGTDHGNTQRPIASSGNG